MEQVVTSQQEANAVELHKVRDLVACRQLAVRGALGNKMGPGEHWDGTHVSGPLVECDLVLALLPLNSLPVGEHPKKGPSLTVLTGIELGAAPGAIGPHVRPNAQRLLHM